MKDYPLSDDTADSTWQSLGLCRTTCQGSYALAVVQGSSCWCSNWLPGDTTSVDDCNKECLGYPYELCGNSDQGLYGYMVLDQSAISGTVGSSSPTSSSESTAAPTQVSIYPASFGLISKFAFLIPTWSLSLLGPFRAEDDAITIRKHILCHFFLGPLFQFKF